MAQNLAPKQLNFCRDFAKGVTSLLEANDALISLVNEWNGNSYATGAQPLSNNITDDVLSGNAQIQDVAYMTAALLNEAEGSVVAINQAVDTHRGYLEAMRA